MVLAEVESYFDPEKPGTMCRVKEEIKEKFGESIGDNTVRRDLLAFMKNTIAPVEVIKKLNPGLSGLIGVDGYHIELKPYKFVYLIAVNLPKEEEERKSFLIHSLLVKSEKKKDLVPFLEAIRDTLNYYPTMVVCDRSAAWIGSIRKVWPAAKIQVCCFHAQRTIDRKMPKRRLKRSQKKLKKLLLNVLYFKSQSRAMRKHREIMRKTRSWVQKSSRQAIRGVQRDLAMLHTHHNVPGAKKHNTNNTCEGTISKISRQLKKPKCGIRKINFLEGLLRMLAVRDQHRRLKAEVDWILNSQKGTWTIKRRPETH